MSSESTRPCLLDLELARTAHDSQPGSAVRILAGAHFSHAGEPSSIPRWRSAATAVCPLSRRRRDACTIASRCWTKQSCFRSASFSSESLTVEVLSHTARVSGISKTAASGSSAELGCGPSALGLGESLGFLASFCLTHTAGDHRRCLLGDACGRHRRQRGHCPPPEKGPVVPSPWAPRQTCRGAESAETRRAWSPGEEKKIHFSFSFFHFLRADEPNEQ